VVGYIPTVILMDEMLENVFGDEVSGIDAVFETETKAVTFTVIHGVGHLVGDGDLHDRSYDSKKEWVVLTNEHDFNEGSPTFRLSLYPNGGFRDAYHTRNPRRGAIGSVCIIIFTSLFFFLYDSCVRREFNSSRELLQARRQFMRFVSHEVRTPLNSVCMGLDLVQSDIGKYLGFESATGLLAYLDHTNDDTCKTEPTCPPPEVVPEEQTHALTRQRALEWFQLTKEIQSNTQGAVDILNDLLNYDKIEQGTLQLSKETIPVWDLIEKTILEFKLPASSKQVDLRVQFGTASHDSVGSEVFGRAQELPEQARDLKVIGDSLRITQVIRNLMSNALKFTAEGGYVEVKAVYEADNARRVAAQEIKLANNQIIHAETRGFLKVVVSDNGAGMSPDEVERLFSEGVQFNPNTLQAGQGSGLGLFIAEGIVEQHQGVLSATSSGHGKGAQLTVILPLWRVVEERESNRTPETSKEMLDHVATASNSTTSLRILVVDDSVSNRKMLRRLLENKGHTCDEAADGAVAVRMIQKAFGGEDDRPYDTVLMDYEMPECDGPTAAQKVRALGIGVYMVGITGNVLPEDVNHFKQCGVNEVMAKPVKLPDLESLWMEYGIYDGDRH
jgi:signal transduction histidine kinase/CheY-like chemotaxis protein